MTAPVIRTSPPQRSGSNATEAGEAMIRFSIKPAGNGAWLWRTFDNDGVTRSHGLAACRKQAAALVIREIIRARTAPVKLASPEFSAAA